MSIKSNGISKLSIKLIIEYFFTTADNHTFKIKVHVIFRI